MADAKAPAAVTKLKAKVSGRTVTLTWKNPADRDFDHVEITAAERKPVARTAAKRVYTGKGTKATTKLAAGAVALVRDRRLRRRGQRVPGRERARDGRGAQPLRARAAREGARQGAPELAAS